MSSLIGKILKQYQDSTHDFDVFKRPDGGFEYKGRLLLHLSTGNKPGDFFAASITFPFNFVPDKFCEQELHAKDYRQIGFIIRDLNKLLKLDGLKAEYARRKDKNGYTLTGIKEIN